MQHPKVKGIKFICMRLPQRAVIMYLNFTLCTEGVIVIDEGGLMFTLQHSA
jgi:hypothetical protein